jgi:hypothetical protein
MFQFIMKSQIRATGLVCCRARADIVVVIIIVVVGVDVSVGIIVVVRARTRIAHLQSERPVRWF